MSTALFMLFLRVVDHIFPKRAYWLCLKKARLAYRLSMPPLFWPGVVGFCIDKLFLCDRVVKVVGYYAMRLGIKSRHHSPALISYCWLQLRIAYQWLGKVKLFIRGEVCITIYLWSVKLAGKMDSMWWALRPRSDISTKCGVRLRVR